MTSDAYVAGPGGLWIKPGLAPLLAGVDTLVFDIDGVLMDTTESYPEASSRVVQLYFSRVLRWPGEGALLLPAECELFKAAGGFNNDWHVSAGAVLFYLAKAARIGVADLESLRAAPPGLREFTAAVKAAGGGLDGARQVALAGLPSQLAEGVLADWDLPLIERLGCEVYGGVDGAGLLFGITPRHVQEPGLFHRERPLLDPARLARGNWRVGVYTGRQAAEAGPALAACGLAERVAPELLCAADGPYLKPDPAGLRHLAARLGTRAGLFFGDNLDDIRTVLNYRAAAVPADPPFFFAGILGGALGEQTEPVFRELGADLIAPDVNTVLDLLLARQEA